MRLEIAAIRASKKSSPRSHPRNNVIRDDRKMKLQNRDSAGRREFQDSLSISRAQAVGALALGGVAIGALAVGAVALGALAIGRLAIGRAKIRRLEIDELIVRDRK